MNFLKQLLEEIPKDPIELSIVGISILIPLSCLIFAILYG